MDWHLSLETLLEIPSHTLADLVLRSLEIKLPLARLIMKTVLHWSQLHQHVVVSHYNVSGAPVNHNTLQPCVTAPFTLTMDRWHPLATQLGLLPLILVILDLSSLEM